MKELIESLWDNIANASGDSEWYSKVDSFEKFDIYLGVIKGTGSRVFLFEVKNPGNLSQKHLKKFRGVSIEIIPWVGDSVVLAITLEEETLKDVFSAFIADITENILETENEQSAIALLYTKIANWKSLFAHINKSLLSDEEQLGLYGEIYLLRNLLQKGVDAQMIISSWKGPSGNEKDFNNGYVAIEVKSTNHKTDEVKISNEFQLDDGDCEILYLNRLKFRVGIVGESLPILISEVRHILKADLEILDHFNSLLLSAGYSDADKESYELRKYIKESCEFYLVNEDFPRVLKKNIHQAVSKLEYRINMLSCSVFKTKTEQVYKSFSAQ